MTRNRELHLCRDGASTGVVLVRNTVMLIIAMALLARTVVVLAV